MSKRGSNEGSIYQRSDGRWCAVVNLGWLNGKRKRKSYYGATRKDVQEQLAKVLSDIQKGLPIISDKQTVGQYLGYWLEEVVKRETRPMTYSSYEYLSRVHIIPALGTVALAKLSTQQIRQFLNEKQDSGLSSRTVQYLHAVLRKALNVALRDQMVIRNVAALVEPPRVTAKEVQPLSPDEARRFLQEIDGDRLQALYVTSISLGLRQSEALALQWRDIDLESGKLRIRYQLQRFKPQASDLDKHARSAMEVHLVEPKTKKSRRTIDMPQVTLLALAAHRMQQSKDRMLAGTKWAPPLVHCEGNLQEADFVFTTPIGTPLYGCNLTRRFQKRLQDAGIEHHRFHDLRHTAATLLAVQGVHPKTIQAVLGWDQASMMDRYTHFVDEMRQEAAKQMDAILKPVAVSVAVKHPVRQPS